MNCSKIYKIFRSILFTVLLGLMLGVSALNLSSDEPMEIQAEAPKEELMLVGPIDAGKDEVEIVVDLGEFVITAYCPCGYCSGGYGTMTSTGVNAIEGRTIAVDPDVIPYGTEVIIDGRTYIAEDCGGAIDGNEIDIFFEDHGDTDIFGKQSLPVSVVVRGDEV